MAVALRAALGYPGQVRTPVSIFRQPADGKALARTAGPVIGELTEGIDLESLPSAEARPAGVPGVATVVFSLFIVAYADRMLARGLAPLARPVLLWLNTVHVDLEQRRLAVGNGQRAPRAGGRREAWPAGRRRFRVRLPGRPVIWHGSNWSARDISRIPTRPTPSLFLLTALHAVHLLGGLVAWGRTGLQGAARRRSGRVRLSVELCAVYWHFLLVVWVVLFALLLFT